MHGRSGAAGRLRELREELLAQRDASGIWRGRLSSSALSTAVASVALALDSRRRHAERLAAGAEWLVAHQNADGSWGDTPESPGNVATTLMSWAALQFIAEQRSTNERAEAWITRELGSADGDRLIDAVLSHYGRDRTFSVPILVLCAICGVLGDDAWRRIPRLPAEVALLPRSFYRRVGLPVVSYALPALISMGLCVRAGRKGGPCRTSRMTALLLRRIESMQPGNGGFLEAIPLTGFVSMSLIFCGLAESGVVARGVGFLVAQQRDDGSWPIDSELSTWVTTLSVKALTAGGVRPDAVMQQWVTSWLLSQQFSDVHPFTGAKPGGWGWSPLPGSVPDADDTAGALVALKRLEAEPQQVLSAAEAGVRWLLDLQNRDGGIPTFCRGWGKLPFDRSCPDLTAHTVLAWSCWADQLPTLSARIQHATARAVAWLKRVQRDDGAWLPLWFGNQQCDAHANPVYGTATVVRCLGDAPMAPELVDTGRAFLCSVQNPDGSWGGDVGVSPTLEETSLAVSALASGEDAARAAALRGVEWLCDHATLPLPSAPIGLYFASLWYDEKLYPLAMAGDALGRMTSR